MQDMTFIQQEKPIQHVGCHKTKRAIYSSGGCFQKSGQSGGDREMAFWEQMSTNCLVFVLRIGWVFVGFEILVPLPGFMDFQCIDTICPSTAALCTSHISLHTDTPRVM